MSLLLTTKYTVQVEEEFIKSKSVFENSGRVQVSSAVLDIRTF